MALTSSDIAGLLTPGLKTAFFGTFDQQGHQYKDIATVIPSDKESEHYAWLGAVPLVNEFTDERVAGAFKEYDYSIKNKTWESTIAVDRAAIEDDQYGQIAMKAKMMGQSAVQHLDTITYGLLAAGFTSVCFDGQPYFGTHQQGDAQPQTNHGIGLLNSVNLQAAITAMMRFTDDRGRPMGIMPDTLVVPPELYWDAAALLNSAFFPDAVVDASQHLAANTLKGLLKLTTTPFLGDPSSWYLIDSKRVVKPIILQMRKDFDFQALEQNSETGFMRDVFYYGVRARYNVGFGDWRAAYGSTLG